MNAFRISVPSKTFLVGEYLALKGGPSIVLGTDPHFEIRVSQWGATRTANSIVVDLESSQGPLKRAFERLGADLTKLQFELMDPHHLRGGFGRSGAEFIALAAAKVFVELKASPGHGPLLFADSGLLPRKFLREVLDLYKSSGGTGSGADLVTQVFGGITVFGGTEEASDRLAHGWPFRDLELSLFRTGVKVPTHLAEATSADWNLARELSERTRDAVLHADDSKLIESVNRFREWMFESGFEALATTEKVSELRSNPDILAVKGCGALGADVILCVHRGEHRESVAAAVGLERVCVVNQTLGLSKGIEIHVD